MKIAPCCTAAPPIDLTRKEDPGPNENFSGSGDECNFLCFAAAHESLIKGFERIVPTHAPKSAHIEETADFAVAHFGDTGMFAYTSPTFVRFGIQTDIGHQSSGIAFATGQIVPLEQFDQQGHTFSISLSK